MSRREIYFNKKKTFSDTWTHNTLSSSQFVLSFSLISFSHSFLFLLHSTQPLFFFSLIHGTYSFFFFIYITQHTLTKTECFWSVTWVVWMLPTQGKFASCLTCKTELATSSLCFVTLTWASHARFLAVLKVLLPICASATLSFKA